MAQRYDTVSKYLIRGYPQPIAGLILGDPNVEVTESVATAHTAIQQHSDINFKVRYPDGTLAVLHIEVQTHDSQEPMPLRMAAYHGLLIKEHKMPVYGCVIYLHPNAGRTDPGRYAYEWDGGRYLMQYRVIRMSEIDGQAVLEARHPGLLAFAPLMKWPGELDATRWLDRCVNVVGSSEVAVGDQLAALGILSSLIYDTEQIRQLIPEGLMHEFPLIQEFVDEAETRGIKQGIEQGIERGEKKGVIESILTLLETRFHPDAVQILKPNLETIDDLARLKELLIVASRVENFEEFARTLHE